MQKYIAFGLYSKNEQGAFQPAGEATLQQDVYLAKDVDALTGLVREMLKAYDEGFESHMIELLKQARSLMEK
jgi:hypothetical protein